MPYGRDKLNTGRRKRGRSKTREARHNTLSAFVLIPSSGPPTWPKDNPTRALPRAIPKRVARAKTGIYLKQFGSRPEGRSDQDRKRTRALRWLARMVRAAA